MARRQSRTQVGVQFDHEGRKKNVQVPVIRHRAKKTRLNGKVVKRRTAGAK